MASSAPSLRYLRITSEQTVVLRILSWLRLPQTTFIHITERFCDVNCRGTELRSIAGPIDRLCLQQAH